MMSEPNRFSLSVREAYPYDRSRGIARIDLEVMEALELRQYGDITEDVIEIEGKRKTLAKCLPLAQSEKRTGIIRIDNIIRKNAGAYIRDIVGIRKVSAFKARIIELSATNKQPSSQGTPLATTLEGVPAVVGDRLRTGGSFHESEFVVDACVPAGHVVINDDATFIIEGKMQVG